MLRNCKHCNVIAVCRYAHYFLYIYIYIYRPTYTTFVLNKLNRCFFVQLLCFLLLGVNYTGLTETNLSDKHKQYFVCLFVI